MQSIVVKYFGTYASRAHLRLNRSTINMSNTIFSSHLVHFPTNHPPCHQNFSYLSLYLQHTILVEHKKMQILKLEYFSANESHVVIPIIVAILVFPILVIASICFVRSPLTSVIGLSSWSILFLNFISHEIIRLIMMLFLMCRI